MTGPTAGRSPLPTLRGMTRLLAAWTLVLLNLAGSHARPALSSWDAAVQGRRIDSESWRGTTSFARTPPSLRLFHDDAPGTLTMEIVSVRLGPPHFPNTDPHLEASAGDASSSAGMSGPTPEAAFSADDMNLLRQPIVSVMIGDDTTPAEPHVLAAVPPLVHVTSPPELGTARLPLSPGESVSHTDMATLGLGTANALSNNQKRVRPLVFHIASLDLPVDFRIWGAVGPALPADDTASPAASTTPPVPVATASASTAPTAASAAAPAASAAASASAPAPSTRDDETHDDEAEDDATGSTVVHGHSPTASPAATPMPPAPPGAVRVQLLAAMTRFSLEFMKTGPNPVEKRIQLYAMPDPATHAPVVADAFLAGMEVAPDAPRNARLTRNTLVQMSPAPILSSFATTPFATSPADPGRVAITAPGSRPWGSLRVRFQWVRDDGLTAPPPKPKD